jgi:hypothetical protein
MPAKGTKKSNPTGKQSRKPVDIPQALYDALEVSARERGLINLRNGQGNRTKLIEEMFQQMSYLDKAKAFYSQIKEYALDADADAALIQKAVVDILFPLGLWGEEEQRKKLEKIAHPRHHEKIWELLKFYEQINAVSIHIG